MPNGIVVADLMTTSDGVSSAGVYGLKNRLINSDMRIDQRNAGASVTPVSGVVTYTVDRWAFYVNQASKLTTQRSTIAPVGFINSLSAASSSAYSVLTGDAFFLYQPIEGLNISDLAWGTASAATVSLSFWVRSSLTGTFSGSLQNSGSTRSYPFTFTINSANTWEKETITITGDTSGTWLTTNGIGLQVIFSLGAGATFSGTAGTWAAGNIVQATGATSVVGTNGATFYITGVQLEKGSTATSFDYLDYGRSLAQCQRYYEILGGGVADIQCTWYATAGAQTAGQTMFFKVTKRATPTVTKVGTWSVANCGQPTAAGNVGVGSFNLYATSSAAGLVTYNTSSSSTYLTADIEL